MYCTVGPNLAFLSFKCDIVSVPFSLRRLINIFRQSCKWEIGICFFTCMCLHLRAVHKLITSSFKGRRGFNGMTWGKREKIREKGRNFRAALYASIEIITNSQLLPVLINMNISYFLIPVCFFLCCFEVFNWS